MFFLLFLVIAGIVIFALKFSILQIEIRNFKFYANVKNAFIEPRYEIFIKIYIFKTIKLLEKKVKNGDFKNQKRLKKLQDRLKGAEGKDKQSKFKIFKLQNIKNSKIRLKNTNLKIQIDTENAAITAVATGSIYGVISNFLNYFFELHDNINIQVVPIYQNKNQISFSFDGIFEIDLIHIINTYKVLIGKDKEEKNNGTSNRESYAYNNG